MKNAAAFLAIFCIAATAAAESVRILRVGDSVTRLTAINPVLWDKLTEAGVEVQFVGAQNPAPDRAGLSTSCEGYNGRPMEFFTTHQATYGDEPFSDHHPMTDAIPLKRALDEYRPHVVLAMVGINDLSGNNSTIPTAALTAKLEQFCDRLEEWAPPGMKFVISTVPPANEAKDPGNPNRNQRHRLYGEEVVRPVVERRIAAGKPYTLADPYPAMTPEDLKDGVHPNAGGKAKLNEVWAAAILKSLGRS